MRYKFKIDNIIYDLTFMAKVIGRTSHRYQLLYSDGSSGWIEIWYVEKMYDRIKFNTQFFDLFAK